MLPLAISLAFPGVLPTLGGQFSATFGDSPQNLSTVLWDPISNRGFTSAIAEETVMVFGVFRGDLQIPTMTGGEKRFAPRMCTNTSRTTTGRLPNDFWSATKCSAVPPKYAGLCGSTLCTGVANNVMSMTGIGFFNFPGSGEMYQRVPSQPSLHVKYEAKLGFENGSVVCVVSAYEDLNNASNHKEYVLPARLTRGQPPLSGFAVPTCDD